MTAGRHEAVRVPVEVERKTATGRDRIHVVPREPVRRPEKRKEGLVAVGEDLRALFAHLVLPAGLLLFVVGLGAQVSAPLVGWMRDLGGALRPVHGVAGAFVVGEAVERDVVAAAWSGASGFAKTDSELLVLNAGGVAERMSAPAGPATFGFLADGAAGWVRFADGSCRSFGTACPDAPTRGPLLRARLPESVTSFEQLGDGWVVARDSDALYAVHVGRDEDRVYRLPEAER